MEMKGLLPPKLRLVRGSGYCFGCGKDNPIGLKLEFTWDGEVARAKFIPGKFYQGWEGLVHGGILYTLLDEAMGYLVYYLGLNCVTAESNTRFRKTALVNEPILISATITKRTKRLVETKATLTSPDGSVVAEGTALMYVANEKPARAAT